MARMSIYLPDPLKARMDSNQDEKWSQIAQVAFEQHLVTLDWKKPMNIDTAVERIIATKVADEKRQEKRAREAGTAWAMQNANYRQLKQVEAFWDETNGAKDDDLGMKFDRHMCGDIENVEDSWWFDPHLEDVDVPDDDYMRIYLDAIMDVWVEVKKKL